MPRAGTPDAREERVEIEREQEVLRQPRVEDEQFILGSAFISRKAAERVLDDLQAEDFYLLAHQTIFNGMRAVDAAGELVSEYNVKEWLSARGKLAAVGGWEYLVKVSDRVPAAADVGDYIRIVREAARKRRLADVHQEGLADLADPLLSADELEERADARLLQATTQHGAVEFATPVTLAERFGDRQLAPKHFLPTGFTTLDDIINGLCGQRFSVLAGRPSMGKTAAIGCLTLNIARTGAGVGVFSLEMPGDDLYNRWISSLSGVNGQLVDRSQIPAESWDAVGRANLILSDLPIRVDDRSKQTLGTIRRAVRRMQRQIPLKVVFVDYLQLVDLDYRPESVRAKFTAVAEGLKALAKEMGIHVCALSQLSRECEKRENKRPLLSDLMESGGIEAAANMVIGLYRGAYYAEKQGAAPVPVDTAEWVVLKNRDGATGTAYLDYHRELTLFLDPMSPGSMPVPPPRAGRDRGEAIGEDVPPARSMRDRVREEREANGGELALNGAAHHNGHGRGGY